jgi:hypothetical protein
VGLDCAECVRQSARQLALVAEGLSAAQARTLFFTMYPADECRPMASEFARLVGRLQMDTPVRQPPSLVFLPLAEAVA